MLYTISGFWTSVLAALFIMLILFLIMSLPGVYQFVSPSLMILFVFLVIIRLVFPYEIIAAREIFFPQVVPLLDDIVRAPVVIWGEKEIAVWAVLAFAWFLIGIVRFVRMLYRYFAARRIIYRYRMLDAGRRRTAKEVEKELNIKDKVIYKISDNQSSPFIFGVLQPVVVLPDLAETFTEPQLVMMLRHELSHYKKNDCVIKMLFEGFCCLFWFPMQRGNETQAG